MMLCLDHTQAVWQLYPLAPFVLSLPSLIVGRVRKVEVLSGVSSVHWSRPFKAMHITEKSIFDAWTRQAELPVADLLRVCNLCVCVPSCVPAYKCTHVSA